jgi:hypothetical protein
MPHWRKSLLVRSDLLLAAGTKDVELRNKAIRAALSDISLPDYRLFAF